MASRLMVLDTASLYFRAFFGVPDSVRAPDGTPVNAVRGLLDFITRLATTYAPTHLVCAWDDDWRPQWRVDLIDTYKAHRLDPADPEGVEQEQAPDELSVQIPIIREALAALQLPVTGASGYEADDVIGTLAARSTIPVDVVTGDRDLFQLIDDTRDIRVLYTARGVSKLDVLTEQSVVDRYGVRPQSYVDFATLRGDSSDGLPGVKGVGEKTAATLLDTFGTLDAIVTAANDDSSRLTKSRRAKILDAADYLAVAPTVVRVAADVPLPADLHKHALLEPLNDQQQASAAALAERWGLGGSMARAIEAVGAS